MITVQGGFQIALILTFAALFVLSLFLSYRRGRSRREIALWAVLWGMGLIVSIRPSLTTAVARALGIGRGADLVFYCGIVVMLVGFLMVYLRLRRLRREMTLLVRHIARLEAELNERGGTAAQNTKGTA